MSDTGGERRIGTRHYQITTEFDEKDSQAIHAYLTRSYWSEGISLELVQRAMRHSLCFVLRCYNGDAASVVGFARMISDFSTYAYLSDVYVLEPHRRQGLADWLVQTVLAHPDLQGLRRLQLITRDAHALYARHGFKPLAMPERGMEISRPGLYLPAGG